MSYNFITHIRIYINYHAIKINRKINKKLY